MRLLQPLIEIQQSSHPCSHLAAMTEAIASDREKDFRTLCTLALINSKHAHYVWSLKRLVKEDLLREGAGCQRSFVIIV